MDTNKLKAQLAAIQDEINRTAEQYGLGGHLQYLLNGGEIRQLPVAPYGYAKDGVKSTTSIVDVMKDMGEDSSFANRKKMAEAFGIKGYTGTAAQNQELMQKYYASKRETIAPMESRSAQPIPTSGMQRPMPNSPVPISSVDQPSFDEVPGNAGAMMMNNRAIGTAMPAPIAGGESIAGEPYSFDELPNTGAMMMNDSAGGTAYPPDTRMRTLDDLGPREAMPTPDLSRHLTKTPIADMNETMIDYFRSHGFDPSYAARKEMFSSIMPGYKGTYEQNIELLKKIKSGDINLHDLKKKVGSKPTGQGAKKPPVKSTAPPAKSSEVYNTLNDKVNFTYITDPISGEEIQTLRYDPDLESMVKNNPYDQFFGGYNTHGEPMGFGVVSNDADYLNNNRFKMTNQLGPTGGRLVIYPDGSIWEMYNTTNGDEYARGRIYPDYIRGSRGELNMRSGRGYTSDEEQEKDDKDNEMAKVAALTRPTMDWSKVKKRDGGMNSYYSGGEIENDPHIMELYGFQGGGQIMEIPVAPYGYAEMGMMMGDDVTGKGKPLGNPPATPKQLNSQQLASLATNHFSKDPSMQTPLPNFVSGYQLSELDKTLMMEAMKQMKAMQGSTGAYPAITPQMIDGIRPRVEQNRTIDYGKEMKRMGGMNYEDGGQMPVDVAVARFKAAGKDKGLSGGELQVYVEKMKSKYNYQKGGVVKEQELGNYEVGMYGSGGIMYNGTKFPGYNKAVNTAPGDKFKKQMLLQKGGKIKLVKFGHR